MTTKARLVVFAYHEVGYRCLEWLLAHGETVRAVFTHEDRPDENVWFRSVAALARAHGVPVLTPATLKDAAIMAAIAAYEPDILYSFYYRHMIPEAIRRLAARGAFNMHGSLLPAYRGRVPINWAIIHGQSETGATLHHMVARADAGDIVDQERVAIGPEDRARDVLLKVADAAVTVLARAHPMIVAGCAPRRVQDETQASTYGARRPEDGRIDWRASAASIFNLVRALTDPYPGAFSEVAGERFLIWWGRPVAWPEGVEPGRVVSVAPLIVATGKGGFRIDRWEWARKGLYGHHGFSVGEKVGP